MPIFVTFVAYLSLSQVVRGVILLTLFFITASQYSILTVEHTHYNNKHIGHVWFDWFHPITA